MTHRNTKEFEEDSGEIDRRGDYGMTRLSDGTRVAKDSPYIEAVGAVDDLNCWIEIVIAATFNDADVRSVLIDRQGELETLKTELLRPGSVELRHEALHNVESELLKWRAMLAATAETAAGRGVLSAAFCSKAQVACRALERGLVGLTSTDPEGAAGSVRLPYVNRLSDLLGVIGGVIRNKESFKHASSA